jgi:DNA-binding response OmpR family regulator
MKIVLIDDEPAITEMLSACLKRHSHDCLIANTAQEGLFSVREHRPDVVLLDVNLPDMNGVDVCREIRALETADPIIIFLTGHTSEADHVAGFYSGADDYIDKPCNTTELPHRIRAIADRYKRAKERAASQSQQAPGVLRFDNLEIDPSKFQVSVWSANGTQDIKQVTPLMFKVLLVMAEHPGRVWDRETLLNHIQGNRFTGSEDSITTYIKALRRQLDDPRRIRTHHSVGYSFESTLPSGL